MIKFIYDLIYVLPFCLAALIFSRPYLGIKEISGFYLFASIILMIIYELYVVLKAKGRLVLSGVILAAGLAVFLVLSTGDFSEFLSDGYEYLLLFLAASVSFGLSRLMISHRIFRLLGSAGMLSSLIITMFFDSNIHKLGTYCVFLLVVVTVLEEIQFRWKKTGFTEHQTHLVSTAPFILVLFLLVYVIPVADKPYSWSWVRYIVSEIQEKYNDFLHELAFKRSEDYFMNTLGFSDRGNLGEGIKSEPDEMLQITVSDLREDAVYLTGKVFDTFQDGEWINTNNSMINDRLLDTLEMRCAAQNYSSHFEDMLKSQKITINYITMASQYMFIPDKVLWGFAGVDDYDAIPYGNSLVFKEKKGYQSSYELQYYVLNRGKKNFKNFVESGILFTKSQWDESTSKFRFNAPSQFTYDSLLDYRNRIYDVYLPDTELSDDLREAMDGLYKDCKDDIDKLAVIEGLLHGFEYTETPGGINVDAITPESYLDYFILHKQKGYCTYFATAFVLLARAEGIPARYVQGYYVPIGTEKDITVTSDMAHAWPEVYIDGIGWLIYEPTPGYRYLSSWTTYEERQSENEGSDLKKYVEKYKNDDYEEEDISIELEVEEDEESFTIQWYVIVLPIGLLVLILILIFVFEKLIMNVRFKALSEEERVGVMCKKCLNVLRFIVRSKKDNETYSEYKLKMMDAMKVNDLPGDGGAGDAEDDLGECAIDGGRGAGTAGDRDGDGGRGAGAAGDKDGDGGRGLGVYDLVDRAFAFIDVYEYLLYSKLVDCKEAIVITEESLKKLEFILKYTSKIKYLEYLIFSK